VTCGDPGSRRENVAHSNLDLAVLVPAGDKENLTTEAFLAASAALQGRQKRSVCGLCPGSYERLRNGSIATANILHAAMDSLGTGSAGGAIERLRGIEDVRSTVRARRSRVGWSHEE
jgi:hypothetical protein